MQGLVWLRSDLRVKFNESFIKSMRECERLVVLYIATPKIWLINSQSAMQIDLIGRRLIYLKKVLNDLNIKFIVKQVDGYKEQISFLKDFIKTNKIDALYFNAEYKASQIRRDEQLVKILANKVAVSILDDNAIIKPGLILTKKGTPYKVFTPFKRQWLITYKSLNKRLNIKARKYNQSNLDWIEQNDFIEMDYPHKDSSNWLVETPLIEQQLLNFIDTKLFSYNKKRDFPALDATSKLSPYLALGFLSARQCIDIISVKHSNIEDISWVNELIWRDFYIHVLKAFPWVGENRSFLSWGDNIKWQKENDYFSLWKNGKTGYPLVDAAMRQLLATGWMHNRLRMIVASFLVKDLLVDWRCGQAWFMQNLVDGDFASNNGGWQWAASVGTDAQPYFRIFNPTTQSKRFDKDGIFIKKWLPELALVPLKYIHEPSAWIGFETLDYPAPIVDHKIARITAIDVFKRAKNSKTI